MRYRFLFAFLFLYSGAPGQQLIKGYVVDSEDGNLLPKFYVELLRDNDKWIDIVQTDSSGYFTLELEKTEFSKRSKYQILIDYDKYNIVIMPVNLEKDHIHTFFLTANSKYLPKLPGMIYKDYGGISFGDYQPKEPRALTELPVDIQKKVESYLVNRLGVAFYKKLFLYGGQVVDLDRLDKIENFKKEYQWEAYNYYLAFSDTTLGIARYTAEMVMDKNGKVVEGIELPLISANPSKQNIISMTEAKSIAASLGHFNENTYIDFYYDRNYDSFIWEFSERSSNLKEQTYLYKDLLIYAHSGQVLSMKNESGCLQISPLFNPFAQLGFYLKDQHD